MWTDSRYLLEVEDGGVDENLDLQVRGRGKFEFKVKGLNTLRNGVGVS